MVNGWGQSVFARFKGSSAVSVKLNGGGLYYSYRVDNGPWKKILVQQGTVTLASNLAKQEEHTLHFGLSAVSQRSGEAYAGDRDGAAQHGLYLCG